MHAWSPAITGMSVTIITAVATADHIFFLEMGKGFWDLGGFFSSSYTMLKVHQRLREKEMSFMTHFGVYI